MVLSGWFFNLLNYVRISYPVLFNKTGCQHIHKVKKANISPSLCDTMVPPGAEEPPLLSTQILCFASSTPPHSGNFSSHKLLTPPHASIPLCTQCYCLSYCLLIHLMLEVIFPYFNNLFTNKYSQTYLFLLYLNFFFFAIQLIILSKLFIKLFTKLFTHSYFAIFDHLFLFSIPKLVLNLQS